MGVDEEKSSPSSFDSDEEEDDDDDYYTSEQNLKAERWIDHYSSSYRMLLVGDGDFSFSLSLAKAFNSASNIVATSIDTQQDLLKKYGKGIRNVREIEERGGIVLTGIDAKTMSQHFFLKTQRFDRIIYNFPHVGFVFPEGNGCQIKLNKRLVKGFLKNAKVLLKKDNNNKSEIHVSHKDGDPYDKWDLVKIAEKIGLVLKETIPFCREKYPGYNNKRADGNLSDSAFRLGDSTTFKFTFPKNSVY